MNNTIVMTSEMEKIGSGSLVVTPEFALNMKQVGIATTTIPLLEKQNSFTAAQADSYAEKVPTPIQTGDLSGLESVNFALSQQEPSQPAVETQPTQPEAIDQPNPVVSDIVMPVIKDEALAKEPESVDSNLFVTSGSSENTPINPENNTTASIDSSVPNQSSQAPITPTDATSSSFTESDDNELNDELDALFEQYEADEAARLSQLKVEANKLLEKYSKKFNDAKATDQTVVTSEQPVVDVSAETFTVPTSQAPVGPAIPNVGLDNSAMQPLGEIDIPVLGAQVDASSQPNPAVGEELFNPMLSGDSSMLAGEIDNTQISPEQGKFIQV